MYWSVYTSVASDTRVERETGEDDDLVPKKNSQSVIRGWFGFQKTDCEQTTTIAKWTTPEMLLFLCGNQFFKLVNCMPLSSVLPIHFRDSHLHSWAGQQDTLCFLLWRCFRTSLSANEAICLLIPKRMCLSLHYLLAFYGPRQKTLSLISFKTTTFL